MRAFAIGVTLDAIRLITVYLMMMSLGTSWEYSDFCTTSTSCPWLQVPQAGTMIVRRFDDVHRDDLHKPKAISAANWNSILGPAVSQTS